MKEKELLIYKDPTAGLDQSLTSAVQAWADATTDATSSRRTDLLRDKKKAMSEFITWVNKPMDQITPIDIKTWQAELEGRGLAPATIYGMISRISSFYTWAMGSPDLARHLRTNPVILARPKYPKPYQSESTAALDDSQVTDLLEFVKQKADAGDLVGKRDYALLLIYFLTGKRRTEVIRLCWGDVKIKDEVMVLKIRTKGGYIENCEVREPTVKEALFDYLEASGRKNELQPGSPIWTRHDRAGKPGKQLTSHAFAANLKRYAKKAGIGEIHLHQARHTYARIVAEESGSMIETQDALGHKNLATTKIYVQRLGLKRDKYSQLIAQRVGIE